MVGTFTKGTKSFKDVADFAYKMWGGKGLLKVLQRDSNTFLLKFDNAQHRDVVLTRGTWYVGRRPMVVTRWGVKPGKDCIDSIPIWIKLSNVPDSYWTEDGLSRLASAVGKPIGADELTAKLDVLPFAKMQVLFKLGDPMPEEISAVILDPFTEEKSVVRVGISYPMRPLFCIGCKSFGHSVGACPKVNRVWVKKGQVGDSNATIETSETSEAVKGSVTISNEGETTVVAQSHAPTPVVEEGQATISGNSVPVVEEWTTVKSKKSGSLKSGSESSTVNVKAVTAVNAGQLPIFTALSKSMSRSQLKRVRKSAGKNSPQKK